jgi:fatty-acyl-CoA synthase
MYEAQDSPYQQQNLAPPASTFLAFGRLVPRSSRRKRWGIRQRCLETSSSLPKGGTSRVSSSGQVVFPACAVAHGQETVVTDYQNPTCLAEWFRRRACEAADRPALTFEGRTWSRHEMQRHIEQISQILVEAGVGRGDRVGYFGFDHAVLLLTLFAAVRLGAIFVPINFRLSDGELQTIVSDAGISVLICDTEHAPAIGRLGAALCHRACLGVEEILARLALPGVTVEHETVTAAAGDVAMLIYTSGTTGRPKGVMITHDNVWTSNLNGILGNGFCAGDVALNAAPLFHAAGLNTLTLPVLMAGGHVVLQPSFEAGGYLAAIETYRVTVGLMVPTMMLRVSQHPRFTAANLSSMRLMMTGGAPVPGAVLEVFNNRGVVTNQGYGMTETTSAVVVLPSDQAMARVGSCGRATLLADIKLIDAKGVDIKTPFTAGEICMRGRSIAAGYWNLPKESAETFGADGWILSGDGAYFDEDGFYYICDRIKDMIISGGENIYATEIENVLFGHDAIAEVAVVGQKDPEWGERVVVFASLKPEATLDLKELCEFVAPHLARYKMPRELYLVDSLPRTATGKVSKVDLRRLLVPGE